MVVASVRGKGTLECGVMRCELVEKFGENAAKQRVYFVRLCRRVVVRDYGMKGWRLGDQFLTRLLGRIAAGIKVFNAEW